MEHEAKGIRYQSEHFATVLLCGTVETDRGHLATDTKDSLKSRMRENRKYGSGEGRRQQCQSSTQQELRFSAKTLHLSWGADMYKRHNGQISLFDEPEFFGTIPQKPKNEWVGVTRIWGARKN